jgi:hypothetical protein
MKTETARARESSEVVSWRRDRLVEAGVPLPLASRAARDGRYDVHALIDLVERGCPAELAVRILAPLEELDAA